MSCSLVIPIYFTFSRIILLSSVATQLFLAESSLKTKNKKTKRNKTKQEHLCSASVSSHINCMTISNLFRSKLDRKERVIEASIFRKYRAVQTYKILQVRNDRLCLLQRSIENSH